MSQENVDYISPTSSTLPPHSAGVRFARSNTSN